MSGEQAPVLPVVAWQFRHRSTVDWSLPHTKRPVIAESNGAKIRELCCRDTALAALQEAGERLRASEARVAELQADARRLRAAVQLFVHACESGCVDSDLNAALAFADEVLSQASPAEPEKP